MNAARSRLAERARDLRADFDRAFALPSRADTALHCELIALRAGAEPLALRVAEVGMLCVDRKVIRVPGGSPALLGIAGLRGAIVPVFGAATLLGNSAAQPARWLVVAAAAPIALAFDAFEGSLRVAADSILRFQGEQPPCRYAAEFVRADGNIRPILNLTSVIAALGVATEPVIAAQEE